MKIARLAMGFAQPRFARSNHHVVLAMLPIRQRADVARLLRELGAPLVGDVPTRIELDRDADVVVARQRVFAKQAGQGVELPFPLEAASGFEGKVDGLLEDAHVADDFAADPPVAVIAVDLALAEGPEVVPAFGRLAVSRQAFEFPRRQSAGVARGGSFGSS